MHVAFLRTRLLESGVFYSNGVREVQPILRPLKKKVFQEGGVTTSALDDRGTSTPLESNKSLQTINLATSCRNEKLSEECRVADAVLKAQKSLTQDSTMCTMSSITLV